MQIPLPVRTVALMKKQNVKVYELVFFLSIQREHVKREFNVTGVLSEFAIMNFHINRDSESHMAPSITALKAHAKKRRSLCKDSIA